MEMATYLVCLTRLIYYICLRTIQKDNILFWFYWTDFSVWITLYVGRLFWINYVCESISAKSNKMNAIIHRLTDFLRYADLRDEIYQFTLQLIHHPLKFTGLGLFYFGNGFLRGFLTTIVTYVIIAIQMSDASNIYSYLLKKDN
ncbi:PREDICTED: uncharacterized protein LOC105460840 [Wasmannia auropunctata]|uniref:uncharacterized protein LOC105460840 n=1 Tax=Wasmannia auropunctata TaxID=64793 RepID=UPI0005EE442F|nr:PREDICTED: uncharacterized protein LOC105460840 [Wasmannia auropunctata]